MPRPNPPREIDVEGNVAARIRAARESHGWTPQQLARAVTEAGCPIQTSAIYKIESGQPRRKISVNELIGFSRALGIPVGGLLQHEGEVQDPRTDYLLRAVTEGIFALTLIDGVTTSVKEAFQAWVVDLGISAPGPTSVEAWSEHSAELRRYLRRAGEQIERRGTAHTEPMADHLASARRARARRAQAQRRERTTHGEHR